MINDDSSTVGSAASDDSNAAKSPSVTRKKNSPVSGSVAEWGTTWIDISETLSIVPVSAKFGWFIYASTIRPITAYLVARSSSYIGRPVSATLPLGPYLPLHSSRFL
jgi:hypothetical protein